MKNLILIILISIFFGIACSCQSSSTKIIMELANSMELIVEHGEHWQGKMKVFIFSIKKTPQMAVWIEDDQGRYLATITATNKSVQNKWKGAPKEGRPEALPVWNHKRGGQASNEIDIVSSASLKGPIGKQIADELLIDGNTYNAYLEVNHSFDYNNYWTKDNSGVNGQPSLVYHAQFIAGHSDNISLVPIGYGSVDGSNGVISTGLENFTTALSIVKNVKLVRK
ncbi:MAG: DUF2271 domain-containing protein [Treponema sp.]|nr:DUF2271 domain-containing protein [Treponema sp.]